jgi:hypothetical protein
MFGLEKLFDAYALRARLMPGLFVLLPVAVAIAAWFPERLNVLRTLAGVAALLGGTTLLAQCVRDLGKALEGELFEEWGGIPSTALLRHRDGRLNPLTKERYRRKLEHLIPGIELPTYYAWLFGRCASRGYGCKCPRLRTPNDCLLPANNSPPPNRTEPCPNSTS